MDVLVIGAGVVGLSAAKALAGKGLKVLVVDKDSPGGQSSRAAAGVAVPSFRLLDDPPMLAFTEAAKPVLAAELDSLGVLPQLRRGSGILRLAPDDNARKAMEAKAAILPGWLGRWVDAAELVSLEPALQGGNLHGAFLRDDAYLVDTEVYLTALKTQCEGLGVDVRLGETVQNVQEGSSSVVVQLANDNVEVSQVLVAAGAWAGNVPGLSPLPVKPMRGQMLSVLHPTLRLSRIVSGPSYLAPWRNGEIVVGATEEDAGFENHVTPAGILHLSAVLARLAPAFREARFIRAWSGLRSFVAGGRPLLGRYPETQRVFLGTGHAGQGILTGGLTGRLMAEWMSTGQAPELSAPFEPPRVLKSST
jgi:glycine oxidase